MSYCPIFMGASPQRPIILIVSTRGLGKQRLPGEMIVVADPDSLECTARENDLMGVAARVNQDVRQLSSRQAQFIVDHYDILELMTTNAATGLGAGATMIGQQIKSINATLKDRPGVSCVSGEVQTVPVNHSRLRLLKNRSVGALSQ